LIKRINTCFPSYGQRTFQLRCVHLQRGKKRKKVRRQYAGLYFESFFLKHIHYFKLGVNEHVIRTNFHDFNKTSVIEVFSMTFPGLEITILKFHDFFRFSMTVRTPIRAVALNCSSSPEETNKAPGCSPSNGRFTLGFFSFTQTSAERVPTKEMLRRRLCFQILEHNSCPSTRPQSARVYCSFVRFFFGSFGEANG